MIKQHLGKSPLHTSIYKALFSFVLGIFVLAFISGCSQKEPKVIIKKEYIYEKPFEFVIYDTKGLRVNALTKELQQMCTPVVLETSSIYKNFLRGYEEQINEYFLYKSSNKEILDKMNKDKQ